MVYLFLYPWFNLAGSWKKLSMIMLLSQALPCGSRSWFFFFFFYLEPHPSVFISCWLPAPLHQHVHIQTEQWPLQLHSRLVVTCHLWYLVCMVVDCACGLSKATKDRKYVFCSKDAAKSLLSLHQGPHSVAEFLETNWNDEVLQGVFQHLLNQNIKDELV